MKKFYPLWIICLVVTTIWCSYACGVAIHTAYRSIFPDVMVLKTNYPVAVGKDGHHILYKFQPKRPAHWLSLRQIPRKVVAAILMAEDSGFFQHKGYSPEAIRAAWEHNHQPGVKVKRGGSTITQQLAKNLFLTPEKTMTRKVRELLLAVELEKKFSKAKILETYLNIAEWGPGVYGIENASERYFKKSAANLTAHDAAVLAFMLPNPTKYQYSIRGGDLTNFAAQRVDSILERMWKTGKISDKEYASSSTDSTDELPSSL